ncbi:AbrB family transcriptional regulator [Longimonas halophila]|uniref:AbrB family transcriptional regulator n=1 Tax=Longimonas halophila TaxID=1469170 RepID=A0A2H3NZJ5_9BACT|nr:AbrB/MazE/SpoVT family DNA-binding domain-containing protein [Longimonas halophila]PEN06293.1 AbrB family transcriptional regulator [Longimonas halophila]
MPTSTLTREGYATIPPSIREALDLQPGDQVEFVVDGDRVLLRHAETDLKELDGFLDHSGDEAVSVDAMNDAIRRRACSDSL